MTVAGMDDLVLITLYETPLLCPGQAKAEFAVTRISKRMGEMRPTRPRILVER
jgi:hypothetical protein